ncbi:hypothetical protein EIP86_007803 [Pleurotus ostreatoroseus]|nr:hypothetical protein EIP86_007803 [Pleurotus ostreatoroseus]
MPLISVTHLSFSSADLVSELSEGDLEKAVDKVGRTARRTVDTHVKHAISRPRVASTLRRMTAMFNFLPDLPPIISEVSTPELRPPIVEQKPQVKAPHHAANATPPSSSAITVNNAPEEQPSRSDVRDISIDVPRRKAAPPEDSETEKSSDEGQAAPKQSKQETSSSPPPPSRKDSPPESSGSRDRAQIARSSQKPTSKSSKAAEAETSSDAGPSSSPARPAKKAKRAQVSSSSDDEDSEAERKRHLSQLKGSSTRGAKQPLKRGGRRF